MSKPLSPQAQAVDRAIAASIQLHGEMIHAQHLAAAALRAVADQVVPQADTVDAEEWIGQSAWQQAEQSVRFRLLAIAAELDGGKERATSEYPAAGRDACDCKGIAGDNGKCDDACRRAGLR